MTGNKILLIDFSMNASELKANLDRKFEPNSVEIVCDPGHYSYFKDSNFENDVSITVVNDSLKNYEYFHSDYFIYKHFRKHFIPVIELSELNVVEFPKNSELFEIHVPKMTKNTIEYIYSIFHGFKTIQEKINTFDLSSEISSYSEILYEIFEKKCNIYEISQYFYEIYKNNFFIYERIIKKDGDIELTKKILKFVLGHILINAMFRFPGPILSEEALCAYIGVDFTESNTLDNIFNCAAYNGPFSEIGKYYWKADVDKLVDKMIDGLSNELDFNDYVALRRFAIERKVGNEFKFKRHQCNVDECNGDGGGYFCPYSGSVVCGRSNCSIPSSSWLPQGANICRIQYDFYSKWKPLLKI